LQLAASPPLIDLKHQSSWEVSLNSGDVAQKSVGAIADRFANSLLTGIRSVRAT